MIVEIYDAQDDFPVDHEQIKQLVKEFVDFQKVKADEVGVHLVSNDEMCRLHELYFDDPSPTDCISFPLEYEPTQPVRNLGDIYLCPKVALEYATDAQVSAYEEVSLYIVHGLLHLLGYDDIEERVDEMRKLEHQNMENLKNKQLILRKL